MPKGGARVGAGRPKGVRNKRTQEIEAASRVTVAKLLAEIPDAFEGDAHAMLVSVYKNPALELPLRVDAAKAAIRYEKPALSSVEAKVETEVRRKVRTIRREVIRNPDHTDTGGVPTVTH